MKKSKVAVHWCVLVAAILGIAACEVVALLQGHDGLILTIAVAAMAGIAGWSAPQLKIKE